MKKIISFVLVMLISCTVYANEFITVEKCSSNVNGEFYANIHSWHYPFLCYNDVTYAPVDTFAQSFGNDAEFNERTNTYNLTKSVFDGSVKFGQTKPAIHVSFKELLKNPQKYIGKHVSVEGYLRVAFEEDNLFLTYDDYKYFNTNNSISLNFRTILLRALNASIGDLSTISGRYVTIQGVFKQLWEYPERYMLSHINYVEAKGKGTRLQKYENFTEYDEGDYKAEICEAKLWLDGKIYKPVNEHDKKVPVFKYNGQIYLPLRTYAKAFDLHIEYDENKDEIKLYRNCNMDLKEFTREGVDYSDWKRDFVSTVSLLANPQKYSDKYLCVDGALKDGKLYMDTTYSSDYIELEPFDGINEFDESFVEVVGRFKKQNDKLTMTVDYMRQRKNTEQYPCELYWDQWSTDYLE